MTDNQDNIKGKNSKQSQKQQKADRLSAALRENLKKRKHQMKERVLSQEPKNNTVSDETGL